MVGGGRQQSSAHPLLEVVLQGGAALQPGLQGALVCAVPRVGSSLAGLLKALLTPLLLCVDPLQLLQPLHTLLGSEAASRLADCVPCWVPEATAGHGCVAVASR